ncbi:MAG: NAD(P)-binding protein [Rhizobiales bacterium]|nr:NAD(P)-binding protein [Hyphomicrobiales bacterium]
MPRHSTPNTPRRRSSRISRRSVLALGPAIAAALLAAGRARASDERIVVVGAGLAGLGAARMLAAGGAEVIVLEARERIGGRIHTSRNWPDVPVDLGASWIHGTKGNPLTALAREAGARRVATSYDAAVLIGPDGESSDPDMRPAERILRSALRAVARGQADMSVMAALEKSAEWQGTTEAQRRLVLHLVNSTLEQEYAAPADRLSALHGDDGEEFGGGDVIFPDGFDRITALLAKGLDIRTSMEVVEVSPDGVRVADGTRIGADRVVCTVPLGVLQAGRPRFTEPLGRRRQVAIEGLGTGLLNKCWLRFDRIAWPDDVDWIEWLGPTPGLWAEWLSLARGMRAPVLLGFNAGHEADTLEALDDRATMASAHEALRAMFGSRFPAPLGAQVTRWRADPFSAGSYSYNAVGTSGATRRDLGQQAWDGRLWFAGEACEPDYFGTAHGALMSGERVARAILSR